MQLFQMQVSKTAIYRTAPVRIPKGIMGAAVKLSFSPEWEGLTKTVVFRAGEITKDVLDVQDVAVIPAECTREAGALLEIGVYGVDRENTVAIPTLWAAIGRITEAADPSGDTTTDTQLPVWAQLLEMITQLEEQGVTQREIEAAVRDFFGGDRPVGQHTPEGGEIFNDYENNQALAPYAKADGVGCRAGIHGYKLLAVAKDGDIYNITVRDAHLESKALDNYSVEDILCFDGANHYYDALEIVSFGEDIDGNTVIKVIPTDGRDLSGLAVDASQDEWENWVYVLDKPEAGEPAQIAYGAYAGGVGSVAVGYGAFAHGRDNVSVGSYAHTAGRKNVAHYAGYAKGYNNKALGENSSAEGTGNTANGNSSHAEGTKTTASGNYSHSEGSQTTASGLKSHAEGDKTTASGDYSHAEGASTTASGKNAHAEGAVTTASGIYSHAQGRKTKASGDQSHAEGNETVASGKNQHVQGKFNVEDTANKYAHIVGGGTSDTKRKNIHTIDWDGNAEFAGDVFVGTSREKLVKSSEIPQWAKASEKPDYTADEVGAAPAGFGLGRCTDKLPKVTEDTADTTTAAGWYEYYNVGVPLCDGNTGTDCGGLLVIPSMWGITQFFFCRNYYGGYLRRNYVAGADDGAGGHWEPWEWVNPPLLAGVEYRTTERYAGKPIYIKYISYTAPISVTGSWTFFRIPHGISNFSTLDRLDARVGGGIVFPLLRQNDETISVESVNSANIEIRFKNSTGLNLNSGTSKLRFALHYTKTQ